MLAAIRGDRTMASQTHVNATSFNGLVLLTGEAPGESLRDRITEIARSTPGVNAVQNEVALRAPSTLVARTSDTLVTGKVKLALFQDDKINVAQVKVVTERGTVYLMGLSQAGRSRSRGGNCAARLRRSTRREGHRVRRVTGGTSAW